MSQAQTFESEVTTYKLFMLALCAWALVTLAAAAVLPLDDETETILVYADTAVCGLFFLDFLRSLYRAPKRLQYFLTWGWIDLLSSIPTIAPLRIGRAARAMRILRVLRGVKSARAIAHFLVSKRGESAVLATVLLSLLVVLFSSIAILHFEAPSGGNIRSAEDAIWWATSTLTSVGSGDRYPTTTEGRLIAMFLMAAGMGMFGTFSGWIASWFLSSGARETDSDLARVEKQLKAISEQMKAMSAS